MIKVDSWPILIKLAKKVLEKNDLGSEYSDRLDFEIKEIEKQGANRYWLSTFNSKKKFENNKNGLVLPFLLGITNIDPIICGVSHIVKYHPDFPDIDIDFLPSAREHIKKYAEAKYGSDYVCTVGMWIRYKAKLALQDSATALGLHRRDVIAVCKNLPEEFDTMDEKEARREFESFDAFAEANSELVSLAYGMTGKIKAQSKHAGGLIISSVPIKDYVPMLYSGPKGKKQWASAWTEGMADTQLSKFGFIKFDILGLINIAYIWTCKRMIEKHRGIQVSFDDIDPEKGLLGWIIKDGVKKEIRLDDEKVLKAADDLKLTSIFQFDTDFQQSVVEKGGVKSFTDLVIYTSLGRPGPLPMIDVYIKNRDDVKQTWRADSHPIMQDILGETHGVLTFQEQLLRTWTELCGFTMPEAEAAQKAVKKKRIEILEEIGPKVIEGAAREIGQKAAEELWDKMVSFGRYCFNKSHAVAYIIISYCCLWLKTHFPAEWWAAALSLCPQHKFVRFMGVARTEGIEFGSIDVNNLEVNFTVQGNSIVPGLSRIKGIGKNRAPEIVEKSRNADYKDIDDFVSICGKSKVVLERLIKLGGFDKLHSNRKATWLWYVYKHGTGTDRTKLRALVNHCYAWSQEEVFEERNRQIKEYFRQYPNRKKIPPKILSWYPTMPASENSKAKEFSWDVELSPEQVKAAKKLRLKKSQVLKLFKEDFTLQERLEAEKEYLGYYWSSPLEMFVHGETTSIKDAKVTGVIECVIEETHTRAGAQGKYLILNVTDGVGVARINIWGREVSSNDPEVFEVGTGIRAEVIWKEQYKSFSLRNNSFVVPLEFVDQDLVEEDLDLLEKELDHYEQLTEDNVEAEQVSKLEA